MNTVEGTAEIAAGGRRLSRARSAGVWGPLLHRWGLLLVLLVVIGAFSAWIPSTFPTLTNAEDILTAQPTAIFIALAAMLVLVVGEFDLSLGAILGLSHYLVMKLAVDASMAWPLAVAAGLAVGLVVGALNAGLVVGLRINSFVATIGTATVLAGLLEWISDGNVPIFEAAPQGLLDLGQTELLGIPLPVYYAFAIALLMWLLLEYTVSGRELRATGANRRAAVLAGVRTDRRTAVAFVVAGMLAAVGGVVLSARLGAADATSGPAYLLPAYAAAFLGATGIRPGFFNVWGTLIAIFLVAVGITGLQLQGANSWVTPVFNGLVLLIAVAIANVAGRRRGRGLP